jgi:hypothetical protein
LRTDISLPGDEALINRAFAPVKTAAPRGVVTATTPKIGSNSGINKGGQLTTLFATLNHNATERADLAEADRGAKADFKANGGDLQAVAIIRRLMKMDPDDRARTMGNIIAMAEVLDYL